VRIVSLLPSATEIVYALGLDNDLVGVTFECDEPPAARRDKAVVVGGADTSGMTPGEIDSYVRSQLAASADLYTLHAVALAYLEPDLILTQGLCRVCAMPAGHVADALDYLGGSADVLITMTCRILWMPCSFSAAAPLDGALTLNIRPVSNSALAPVAGSRPSLMQAPEP
jgi:hypothetical protein